MNLNPDELAQLMGIGYLGEVRQAPDGSIYQWSEGIDGLGNPIGFWKKLRRGIQKVTKRALPIAQRIAPRIPGIGPTVAAGIKTAAPYLRQAGLANDGSGMLYEAPDGSLYQMQGVGDAGLADGSLQGLGQNELIQLMGIGQIGEVRQTPDGSIYQWTEGIDGLGNPIGFWKKLRRGIQKVAKKALPIAQQIAPLIPGIGPTVAAGIKTATPYLRRAGLASDGLGALYEAPDGTLYQMQRVADNQEILEANYPQSLINDDLEFDPGYDMSGFADGGVEGYVRQDENALSEYVPETKPATPWFKESSQAPKLWESPW